MAKQGRGRRSCQSLGKSDMNLKYLKIIVSIILATQLQPVWAAAAKQTIFGKLADGRDVPAVTLSNARGVSVTIIAYGATIQSVIMPDRNGKRADIALGHSNIDDYIAKPQYFGSTVGRFANRIAKGLFAIDGKNYQAPVNNGVNSLHGGTIGFDKILWQVVKTISGPTASVTLRHVSKDGDQGYPGTLMIDAIYALDESNNLKIEYRATTDRATIVNITNHAYWNLSGEGSANGAMGTELAIAADTYLPTDAGLIPTGEFHPVAGTPFDFRTSHKINDRVRDASDKQILVGRGYDHNWVIRRDVTATEHFMARAYDPVSGRGFELWSNQPGLQFYSGNFLDATSAGKARLAYRAGDAFALEPQIFPDTPNRAAFGSARLDPGQTYINKITYRLKTHTAK
jgi:aldose 1-epimerase